MAQCGACTVHLNGNAIRSCSMPVSAVGNQKITTIEGLSTDNSSAVQQAWIEEQVPQCGYPDIIKAQAEGSIVMALGAAHYPCHQFCRW